MFKVNNKSKFILDKLWKLAIQNKRYFKLNNNSTFIPLTIEIIENTVISLCHYGEMNGDLMREPEMLFWKNKYGDYFPFYYRNDYVCFEQFVGQVLKNELTVYHKKQQEEQVEFADTWMLNIDYQQFK